MSVSNRVGHCNTGAFGRYMPWYRNRLDWPVCFELAGYSKYPRRSYMHWYRNKLQRPVCCELARYCIFQSPRFTVHHRSLFVYIYYHGYNNKILYNTANTTQSKRIPQTHFANCFCINMCLCNGDGI